MHCKIYKVLDSHDKIPHCRNVGHPKDDTYFNFWRDDKHVRGIWRKTSYGEYKKKGADETKWELILDVDELCKTESESWVYEGASIYHDDNEGKLLSC
jgi:prolyl oligopeptidase